MQTRSFFPLALLLPGAATAANPNSNGFFIAHFDHILGTSLSIKLAASSLATARTAERVILAEIDRLESILSRYRPDSEFSRWLAAPLHEAVTISDDLFAVLSSFDQWREQTGGAINAAAEQLSQLWQQAAQTGQIPTETDRQRAVADVAQIHWQLDTDRQTATRLTPVSLRLNTFAKSYVLDRAAMVGLAVPGINGLVLNGGGDIVVRGNWQETISIANPHADADNATPLTQIRVENAAIATSGDYRRGWQVGSKWVSHLMDPRSGLPARAVISATVLHPDAVTAGALATAFSILSPDESTVLAAQWPGTDYLLITQNGQTITSAGWPDSETPLSERVANDTKTPMTTAHLLSVPAKDKLWKPNQELLISLELPQFEGRSHRPFVAVWVEDEAGKAVRQLALWYNKPRWLNEMRDWYNLRVETDVANSVTSATRSPGGYTLVWDGKDDRGQWVKQGKYTILIEAAREHGSHQLMRQTMDFNGKTKQQTLNGNVEVASAALDYREKSATR